MTRSNHGMALALAVLLLAATPFVRAADPDPAALEQVPGIVEPFVDAGWFSGTVAVYHAGELAFSRSYGLADRERGVPHGADTKLRIGSINKHYTAALVLRLAQNGVFDLDDPLADFDLGFPSDVADQVTIRHLLAHRAGFEDLFTEEYFRTYQSLRTIDDKLPLLRDAPLRFAPGTDRHYSNYGYIVLGAIVERVTGLSFGQALEREILEPIGATETRYALTDEVTDKALSYRFTHTGRKVNVTDRLENLTPDGGMYASAADLVKFYSALYYSDVLIDDRMKAVMMSGYRDPDRSWAEILEDPETIRLGYGGGPGVSAAVELHVSDRLFVVVLANTDGLVAERISQRITQAFRGDRPEPMHLPVALFAWRHLESVGEEAFRAGLPAALESAGYGDFSDRGLNRLGFELFELGDTDEALAVLTVNSELFPQEPNTFDSLGYVYEALGETDLAIRYYRQALELDPGFASAVEAMERLAE